MRQPKKFNEYKCPHGKYTGKTARAFGGKDMKSKDVNGRFCLNNCERMKAKSCKLWWPDVRTQA